MATKTVNASPQIQGEIGTFSLLPESWDEKTVRKDVSLLCNIEPELVEDTYPCTPLQEALRALSTKVNEAYVAQRVVELKDLATAMRLTAAFDEASQHSPILRTRIVHVPTRGLVQVVVRGKFEYSTGPNLAGYLISDRRAAMNLGSPLVRYAIINDVDNDKVSFVLTMHHALYDGWAMPLVVERINKAYEGKPLSRPAEFKHFVKYLLERNKTESAEYWRDQLQGTHRFQFPTLPYEGYQTQADELLEEYVSLENSPRFNTTVATIIRGAWAIVASQYINSSDVVFGETLTGRTAPILGGEEIEGPMITTVPVRVQVNSELQIDDYLQSIQEQIVEQIPHEHFGLQNIRRLSRDAQEACELRTGLVLHPSADDSAAPINTALPANCLVPPNDVEAAQEALKFNTYALMLVCSIDPKGFLVMASFDSKAVDKNSMQRVLSLFKYIAKQLACGTNSTIAKLYSLPDTDTVALREIIANAQQDPVLEAYDGASAAYIVRSEESARTIPAGAIGELAIHTSQPNDFQTLARPEWPAELLSSNAADELYLTGKLARYDTAGKIQIIGDKAIMNASDAPAAARVRASTTSRRQRSLRTLWSRVLRTPETEIELEDNFFLLGGDSISAMKLAAEAQAEGIRLNVAQMFANKSLVEMAAVMEYAEGTSDKPDGHFVEPFSLLDGIDNIKAFLANNVVPQLENKAWTVTNLLPTRYLQQIAVRGTIEKPRFSARYELIFFEEEVNLPRLRQSCQNLTSNNEILRTVFVESEGSGYAAVLDSLDAPFEEHAYTNPAQDLTSFTKDICRADIEKPMPLGSSFVKWLYVCDPQSTASRSCLVFRISHAQYDEMCLPILMRQLSAFYAHDKVLEPSTPFSLYIHRVLRHAIPASIPYWKELLVGSTITTLRPDIPLRDHRHFSVEKSLDISMRNREVTVASLPTAAWALYLARRQGLRDVVFGEVVSGRSIDLVGVNTVTGPCWQYVPLRVRMDESWTGADLIAFVQRQHVESAEHEGISIQEIAELCDPGWEKQKSMTGEDELEQWWFDTVIHQDVSHVSSRETLEELAVNRHEALYLHEEPLREWKIQAFVHEAGNRVTLEVVTFKSWGGYAEKLLEDLVGVMKDLVQRPAEKLFAV